MPNTWWTFWKWPKFLTVCQTGKFRQIWSRWMLPSFKGKFLSNPTTSDLYFSISRKTLNGYVTRYKTFPLNNSFGWADRMIWTILPFLPMRDSWVDLCKFYQSKRTRWLFAVIDPKRLVTPTIEAHVIITYSTYFDLGMVASCYNIKTIKHFFEFEANVLEVEFCLTTTI